MDFRLNISGFAHNAPRGFVAVPALAMSTADIAHMKDHNWLENVPNWFDTDLKDLQAGNNARSYNPENSKIWRWLLLNYNK